MHELARPVRELSQCLRPMASRHVVPDGHRVPAPNQRSTISSR